MQTVENLTEEDGYTPKPLSELLPRELTDGELLILKAKKLGADIVKDLQILADDGGIPGVSESGIAFIVKSHALASSPNQYLEDYLREFNDRLLYGKNSGKFSEADYGAFYVYTIGFIRDAFESHVEKEVAKLSCLLTSCQSSKGITIT